jgi:DNA repair and recombination protein RAD54B
MEFLTTHVPIMTKVQQNFTDFTSPCPDIRKLERAMVLSRPPLIHRAAKNALNKPITDVIIPHEIASKLMDFQVKGIDFLYRGVMEMNKLNYAGVILADEMGLGKTVQVLALLASLMTSGPYSDVIVKRALILMPKMHLTHWENEIEKWMTPSTNEYIVTVDSNSVTLFSKFKQITIQLSTYDEYLIHAKVINNIDYDILICDEAHQFKYREDSVYSSLFDISCKRRILLMTSSFRSDLEQVFSLANFVNPWIFGSFEEFHSKYIRTIYKVTKKKRKYCTTQQKSLK